MGIFDIFKKKADDDNQLIGLLNDANLGIENLMVVESNGNATVTGIAPDGFIAAKVIKVLKAGGVESISNKVTIADLSHLNMQYKVSIGESSNLNCRKGPSRRDEVVGKFEKNSTVVLVQKHNRAWYKVRNETVEGYCHTDYLKAVEK